MGGKYITAQNCQKLLEREGFRLEREGFSRAKLGASSARQFGDRRQFEVRLVGFVVGQNPVVDDGQNAARRGDIANGRRCAHGHDAHARADERELKEHVVSDGCDPEDVEIP